jgi:hypothetical protein
VLASAKAILEGLETDASLPNGKQTRSKKAKPQLGLYGGAPPHVVATNPALDMLRAGDIDRLTPLEALTTLAKL